MDACAEHRGTQDHAEGVLGQTVPHFVGGSVDPCGSTSSSRILPMLFEK